MTKPIKRGASSTARTLGRGPKNGGSTPPPPTKGYFILTGKHLVSEIKPVSIAKIYPKLFWPRDIRPLKMKKVKPPMIEKWWTTIYYGARGSGKSLHQASMCYRTLRYLEYLYWKNPNLKPAIVYSVQRFSPEIERQYLGKYLYYWREGKELQYCPRKVCWKGKQKHRLHGCYLIVDDMGTILPADNWTLTPIWMRKMFAQARHFGIRILANMQDPESVDINFRRYVDMAFKFRKIMGSPDPDETKHPIKRVWGLYASREIKAELLWRFGDMGEADILTFKAKQKEKEAMTGTMFYANMFKARMHVITKFKCSIYDTTQDVPEYKPTGYSHSELGCVDPKHDHINKKAPNYCGFKKTTHEII